MESESVSEKGRPYFQLQYNIYLSYITFVHNFVFLFCFPSIFRWYKYELYLLPIVRILLIFAGIMITTYMYLLGRLLKIIKYQKYVYLFVISPRI